MEGRLINLRFEIKNYLIDAAVDIDWILHSYTQDEDFKKHHTAIELYNFDKPYWDVKMIFQRVDNSKMHTIVDIPSLYKEIENWVLEMES